jgi:uncharacterized protein YbaR (Trm112 family)
MSDIPVEVRALLVCPRCHGPLVDTATAAGAVGLECAACLVRYPVEDGIPVLLAERGRPVTPV